MDLLPPFNVKENFLERQKDPATEGMTNDSPLSSAAFSSCHKRATYTI